jgi:NhaA family Na+:H+ antiporter
MSNAGVVIGGDIGKTLTSPVSLGVILGLVIGKPVGITLFTWLAIRLNICDLPRGLTLLHIQGVSMLAGIGFTVALFITELAFVDDHHMADGAKIGILFASLVMGVMGFLFLRYVALRDVPENEPVGK